jgi:aminoglycoside 2''-phosphotransferase
MPETPIAQAQDILARHLPRYGDAPLRMLGEGWDYTSVLVSEDLVLRLARSRTQGRRLRQEAAVLHLLADRLPLQVPMLRLLPGDGFLAAVYPYIAGVPAEMSEQNLWKLGQFLRALHSIPAADLRGAGIGWMQWSRGGRAWEDALRRFLAKAMGEVSAHLSWERRKTLARRVSAFCSEADNFRFEARMIHADLAPEHLLADPETGVLSAVIDFGDAGLGDPAYDVRPEWTQYYGPVGRTFRTRQIFYRFLEPLHVALYALETGDEAALRGALDRLDV